MYKIISKKTLNSYVDQLEVYAPFVAKNAQAGHFIILRVNEDGERIPLTIVDHTKNTVTIIYQKLGFSTNLLSTLQVGDFIHDFVGPLGRPTEIHDVKRLIAVAGGVGAAPLLPQLRAYKTNGVNIDLVFGARSEEYLILQKEYEEICDNIYYCTNDGSKGLKGFVTDQLKLILPFEHYDMAIAIGPLVMMKAVTELTSIFSLKTDVSLNPIMIDGTGMCGNCRVSINGKTYFACVDGPDFPAEGIDFDELIVRQNYYHDEEHNCNLGLKRK